MKVMKMIPKDWSHWQPFPVVDASNKNGEDTGRRNQLTAHLLKKRRRYVKVPLKQLALKFSLPTTMARMGRSEDKRWQVASSGDEYWLAWYWLASRLVPSNDRITILGLYYWYHFDSTGWLGTDSKDN